MTGNKKNYFSLNDLASTNVGLAGQFVWKFDDWSGVEAIGRYVQIGCGDKPFKDFINLDFIPVIDGVIPCNLLHIWPDRLSNQVKCFYSEDVLEHFFLKEQAYILCSMNYLLDLNGISRVLMPDIDSLWNYSKNFDLDKLRKNNDYFVTTMGCLEAVEALNTGLRMGGHRWLHNRKSFNRLARLCGFYPRSSSCATSVNPRLSGLNIRDEVTGIAFATDLIKEKRIERHIIPPTRIGNAKFIENVAPHQDLFCSTTSDSYIVYDLGNLPLSSVVILNFRSANLSQFNEHNFSKAYFELSEHASMYTDRTLHSSPFMNIFTKWDLERIVGPFSTLSIVRFDPSERPGEYFTAGPIEVFIQIGSC